MNLGLQQMLDYALFWWEFTLETDTLIFAVGILFLTTLLSALYPAVKASKTSFNMILKEGSHGTESQNSSRLMKVLIIVEIALSCALVITAGLMAVASHLNTNVDYGIETKGYVTAEISIPNTLYRSIEELETIKASLRAVLLKEPGIKGVTLSTVVPAKDDSGVRYHKPGENYATQEDYPVAGWGYTDSAYFETFNIKLLEGRIYDNLDNTSGVVKAVVSKSFADQTWPDQYAIGKRFFAKRSHIKETYELEVVGIVPHTINDTDPETEKRGTVYVPSYLRAIDDCHISLKTVNDNPASFTGVLKKAAYKISPDIRIKNSMSLEDGIAQSAGKMRVIGGVYRQFGIVALIFTLAGIYGVMSKSIQQKTKEIGIRRALGATDRTVFFWLLRKGWWQLTIGLILGLGLGGLLTFALMDMIAIVGNFIAVIFLLVALFIVLIVNGAIAVPAYRALKVEPSTALHYE
jgi:ABC-type antimicrobial peptide transport system permease subunit